MRFVLLKGYKSMHFWIAVLLVIIFSFVSFVYQFYWNSFNINEISFINSFFYAIINANQIIMVIAPILSIIAAYKIIFVSKNDDKTSVKNHFFASGIIGGSMFIVSSLLVLLICMMIFKVQYKGNEFDEKVIAAILPYFANAFFVGFVYNVFSFSLRYMNNHAFEAIIYPQILYCIYILFPAKYYFSIIKYMPFYSFETIVIMREGLEHLISIAIVGVLALIIFRYKMYKGRI